MSALKVGMAEASEFERGYVAGYRAALGAAQAKCREIATALDHAGEEYVRYADAVRCASAVGALYVPGLNEPSGNSGQLPIYQYRYLSLREKGAGDCDAHTGWLDCSREEFERYSTYGECITRTVYERKQP